MKQIPRLVIAGAAAWLIAGVASTHTACVANASQPAARGDGVVVTPVAGPSNLRRLGLSILESAMGITGSWGPAPDLGAFVPPGSRRDSVMLTGADIYRLSCRACHRADGTGAPDAIPSVIEPVRSTSPSLMRQRLKKQGRPIGAAFAAELASGSRADLLTQLKTGGEKMPAFSHFTRMEVDAVFAYLELLAGVPGAERRQLRVPAPAMRVGEHLVKGTCHICHGATGAWPDSEARLLGAVPSLAAIAQQRAVQSVLWKVRSGAPVVMGRVPMEYRGRMPTFGYLSATEVAAVHTYLVAYPPRS